MSVHINIKDDNSFEASPIIIGEGHKVTIQGSNSEINWKFIKDELVEASSKLPKSSKEYYASKELLDYAVIENKNELRKTAKKNATIFMSDIFKGVASGALVEIIKFFIHQ